MKSVYVGLVGFLAAMTFSAFAQEATPSNTPPAAAKVHHFQVGKLHFHRRDVRSPQLQARDVRSPQLQARDIRSPQLQARDVRSPQLQARDVRSPQLEPRQPHHSKFGLHLKPRHPRST
jgi:hypothetical protein